jgi:hypothetical protein
MQFKPATTATSTTAIRNGRFTSTPAVCSAAIRPTACGTDQIDRYGRSPLMNLVPSGSSTRMVTARRAPPDSKAPPSCLLCS